MSDTPRGRFQAAIVAIAPVILLAGVAYHPFVARLTDRTELAGAISQDATRWGVAHVAVGIGLGLWLVAFLAVCSYLQQSGEKRWSATAVPFLVMGTTFTLFLPAMETAVGGAAQAGANPESVLAELRPVFMGSMVAGGLLSAAGVIMVAIGIARSGAFDRQRSRILVAALAIVAVCRLIPNGRALYAGAVAGVAALVPIAIAMWRQHAPSWQRSGAALAGSRGAKA